jgi:hypothetical protein
LVLVAAEAELDAVPVELPEVVRDAFVVSAVEPVAAGVLALVVLDGYCDAYWQKIVC